MPRQEQQANTGKIQRTTAAFTPKLSILTGTVYLTGQIYGGIDPIQTVKQQHLLLMKTQFINVFRTFGKRKVKSQNSERANVCQRH